MNKRRENSEHYPQIMSAEAIIAAVVAAGLAVLGKIVFDWLSNKGKPHTSNTAGDMRVDFWVNEFQEVKDKIQALRELVTKSDVDLASIEHQVEAIQNTVNRIEQKINNRRK